jgi:hypothetical protein
MQHQCKEAAAVLGAHPSGHIPPLVLAEHLADIITWDIEALGLEDISPGAPQFLLHELLLRRGIQSELVRGYSIMQIPGEGLVAMRHYWVEACGQKFEMISRIYAHAYGRTHPEILKVRIKISISTGHNCAGGNMIACYQDAASLLGYAEPLAQRGPAPQVTTCQLMPCSCPLPGICMFS